MSKLIYCPIKMANEPYHMKNLDMNFYSLEEVIYFYKNNEILIDKSIMNEDFVYFIANQNEKQLADKLHQIIAAEGTLTMFFEALFPYINTLTKEEKNDFLIRIKGLENKNEFERRKVLSDQLLKRGKYESAIIEYRRLLDSCENEIGVEELLAKIYHNLGCAYGFLFLFDEARECFKIAFSYKDNKETHDAADFLEHAEVVLLNRTIDSSDDDDNILKSLTERGENEHRERLNELKVRIEEYLRSAL